MAYGIGVKEWKTVFLFWFFFSVIGLAVFYFSWLLILSHGETDDLVPGN